MGLKDDVRARLRDGNEGGEIIDELTADGQYTREEVSDALDNVELPSEERAGRWFAHAWLGVFVGILALFLSMYLSPLDTVQFLGAYPLLSYLSIIVAGFGILSIWWGVMKLHDTVRSAAMVGAGLVITVLVGACGYLFLNYRLYLGGLPDLLSFLQWASVIAIGTTIALSICVGALYRESYGRAWTIIPVLALLIMTGMFVNDVGRYPDFEPSEYDYDSLHVLAEQVNRTATMWEPGSVVPPFSTIAYAGQVIQLSSQLQLALGSYVERERLYGPGSSCGGLRIDDDARAIYNPSLLLRATIEQVDRSRTTIVDGLVDECASMRQVCSRDTAVADQELGQALTPFETVADHADRFFAPDRSLNEFAIFDCGSPAADTELRIEDISCDETAEVTIGAGRDPLSGPVSTQITDMAGDIQYQGPVSPGRLEQLSGQQELSIDTELEQDRLYDVEIAVGEGNSQITATAVCRGGDGFCEDCEDREDRGIEATDLTCTRENGRVQTQLTVTNRGLDASEAEHRFDEDNYIVETVYRDGDEIETLRGTFGDETTRNIAFPEIGDRTLYPDESVSMNRSFDGDAGTYRIVVERYNDVIEDPAARGNQYLLNRFEASCTVE